MFYLTNQKYFYKFKLPLKGVEISNLSINLPAYQSSHRQQATRGQEKFIKGLLYV